MSLEKISKKFGLLLPFLGLATFIIAAMNFYFDKIKDNSGSFSITLNRQLLEYTEEQSTNLHIVDFSLISDYPDSTQGLRTNRFPLLKNNTKHTIKNCELFVHFKSENCKPIPQNAFYLTDSTIIYRTNAIPPFGEIETLFNLFSTTDSLSESHCDYQLTHEGISAPIRFTYDLKIINKHIPDSLQTPIKKDYLKKIKGDYPEDNQFFIFSFNDTLVSSTGYEFNDSTIANFHSILQFKETTEDFDWGLIFFLFFAFIYFASALVLLYEIVNSIVEHLVKKRKRITVSFAAGLIFKAFALSFAILFFIIFFSELLNH